MPLYACNTHKDLLTASARARIAEDITNIHCELTGAPRTFVHVFFFEAAEHLPLDPYSVFLVGSIRGGREQNVKSELVEQMRQAIQKHSTLPLETIGGLTIDTPASWVMEGGDVLPEPGEEEGWFALHTAKLASKV